MIHRTLKNLALMSYNKDLLDEDAVNKIAAKLSRKDLKTFIRLLHAEEKKREVYVTSAAALNKNDKEKIEKLYQNKRVVYAIDSDMVSGIKIVENDEEYEINLNKTFHDIMRFLSTK